jgi:hypothetical protein
MKTGNRLELKKRLAQLIGEEVLLPQASIVIPVNAQSDLLNVLQVVDDIARYQGTHRLEIILVINNYPPDSPPKEVNEYRALGLVVLAVPKLQERGEIYLNARIPGVRIASSEYTIHFDADCRVPNATNLIDWYIEQFDRGAQLAYTYVGYYDLPTSLYTKVWVTIHRAFRWFKRVVLRIPISRGSNYAVVRSLILHLYDTGLLNYDIKVGTTIKSIGGKISYSGEKSLIVLTSGRNFHGNWQELFHYAFWRVKYYRHLAPMQPDATRPR